MRLWAPTLSPCDSMWEGMGSSPAPPGPSDSSVNCHPPLPLIIEATPPSFHRTQGHQVPQEAAPTLCLRLCLAGQSLTQLLWSELGERLEQVGWGEQNPGLGHSVGLLQVPLSNDPPPPPQVTGASVLSPMEAPRCSLSPGSSRSSSPGSPPCEPQRYVGIEAMLDQVKIKAMKMGFEFNIMVVGE